MPYALSSFFLGGRDNGVPAWLFMLGHDSKSIQDGEISGWAQGGQKAGDRPSRPAGLLGQRGAHAQWDRFRAPGSLMRPWQVIRFQGLL